MKRTVLVALLLIASLSGMAQNIGDAFYIYRNDGVINAFISEEVDSITYSYFDADSVYYDDIVSQIVYASDSIYWIPLSAIDSVSFVTPETKYKEDVTKIESNLLDYVIGADGLTLKLRADTPAEIIPKQGNKLVLLDGCTALPNGFAGIVNHIESGTSSINVVCNQAYLEDMFDSFCNISTVYGESYGDQYFIRSAYSNGKHRATYNPNDWGFSLGPYKASCTSEISQGIIPGGDLALSGGTDFSVDIEPTFRIHTFLIVGEGQGTYFNCSITGSLRISSQASLYGGLSFNHDFDRVVHSYPIPHTAGFINYYINPGVFVRADATITSKIAVTHNYTFGMAFDYSSKGLNAIKPSVGGRLADSSVDMEGSIEGRLAGGGYIETGFNLICREISRVCVRGEYGYQFSGNYVLRNSDIDYASEETTLYERLKASSVEMGPFMNAGLYASIGATEAKATWELSETHLKCDLVPTFSNTRLTRTQGSSASLDAYTELRGNCLFPVNVGYKLMKGNGDSFSEVGNYEADDRYSTRARQMKHTFDGITGDGHYKVYPKVWLFGHEILASPEAELDMKFPVKLSDFKVTDKQYKEKGFTHEGVAYDYRFDVSVTATLDTDDLSEIADWGYMYQDPWGNPTAQISLKNYGASYTDSRWAYYRNEAHSTCTLYGYVKYEDRDETVYGEPQDYDLDYYEYCPNDNHPHWIDLGLPSGTQWRCCNEGASAPEDYGGHYRFGYVPSAPTDEQFSELSLECKSIWTTLNGVKGRKFTGPNRGSVFFPAAGGFEFPHFVGAGQWGYYWSSSTTGGFSVIGRSLYRDGIMALFANRNSEYSVRPVR